MTLMDRPELTVGEALLEAGISEEEFSESLRAVMLEEMPGAQVSVSARMHELLMEYSGLDDDARARTYDSAVERQLRGRVIAHEVARLEIGSLGAVAAAERLGIDGSRLSHRTREGRLASFQLAGRRRYPLWQFLGDEPLPGLPPVVAAMPAIHPLDLETFMVSPAEALADRSPVEHLATGGEVGAVVTLLEQLDRW
nr:hypothetical protein [Actinomycetales bacterium]